MSLYDGIQYSAEYLEKNPNHCVPTLEITDEAGEKKFMHESVAMVAWLADAFVDKKLAPPSQDLSFERADYLQMMQFAGTTMDMMLWQVRIHEHILSGTEKDDKTIIRYRNKITIEVEPQLINRLNKTEYICGNDFTAADIVVGHCIMWARGYGMCKEEVFKRYLSTISKRPAFSQAYSDAHLFKPELPKRKSTSTKFTG